MSEMKWNKCERPDLSPEKREELEKVFGPNFEHCNVQMKVRMRTKRNWKKVWERNKHAVYGGLTGTVLGVILYSIFQLYH